MEQMKEWKNTVYLNNSKFKNMKEFLPYRQNTISWITKRSGNDLIIMTPNGNYICNIIKNYKVGESTDSLYLVYDDVDDVYFVIRLEDDDYEYVIYAFQFESEKIARNCFRYASMNMENTYTNSNVNR